MIHAAVKAFAQMLSPPFRAVLLKSAGAALVILLVAATALHRLLVWAVGEGGVWVERSLGPDAQGPVAWVSTILTIIAGLGVVAGAILLMPAATALVASFFADEIAEQVERSQYPADAPGRALPVGRAIIEGVKTALMAVGVYLCAVPFLLVAGLGVIIFFFATAFLLGREYFELAAMRHHSAAEAKALRRAHRGTVFSAGLIIAALVSIPILNLATPIFGTAFMVHLHKRLTGRLSGSREAAVRNP
jgi:CysZ protein